MNIDETCNEIGYKQWTASFVDGGKYYLLTQICSGQINQMMLCTCVIYLVSL